MTEEKPSAEDTQAVSAEDRLAEFEQALQIATPSLFVVPLLIVLNGLVYISMVAGGASWWSPTVEALISGGANFGPLTLNRDGWRLLTYMFVHDGFSHLVVNLIVFAWVGSLMERLLGHLGFCCLYLLSGLAGGIASLYWDPLAASAGASGAIFGVYGGLLGALLRGKAQFPPGYRSGLIASSLIFVAFNLIYGWTVSGIDWAAHLGGLCFGFPLGWFLNHGLQTEGIRLRWKRAAPVLIGGTAVLFLAGAFLPRGVGAYLEAHNHFVQVKDYSQDRFNRTLEQVRAERLSDADLLRLLKTDILPRWRAARTRLQQLKRLPEKMNRELLLIVRYMNAQEDCWQLIVQGVEEDRVDRLQESRGKQDEADRLEVQLIKTDQGKGS